MGLDGISINQLRVTPEHNSAELNNTAKTEQNYTKIDGLSQGQKVDPDKEKEKEKNGFNFESKDSQEEEASEEKVEVIKYDLSKSDKYTLKVDEETDKILIIEKATKNVIQEINAQELSQLVNFLSNSQGSIVNRKF